MIPSMNNNDMFFKIRIKLNAKLMYDRQYGGYNNA